MSDQERPRSRSSSRSPRQDSWYMLVQEEVLVSSPTPSPRRSLASSGSRSSSKASSVSSTPKPLQTTSSTAAADQSPASLLQSTTLSQHPLEEEQNALTQYPLEESLDEKQHPSGSHQSKQEDAHIDIISPLGGMQDSSEDTQEHLAVPLLDLDASTDSKDGDQFRGLAKGTFPFVEEDESAAMSSDTDIPIPLSDNEDNESGFPGDAEDFGMSKDAVQEAIAEVSADFVSGVLAMSVSQHSVDGTKVEDKMNIEDNTGAGNVHSMVIEDVHSSAATTPWQSEGGMEIPTPSPCNQEISDIDSDRIPREQISQQSHVSSISSSASNRTKSSVNDSVRSEISARTASLTVQLKPSAEDMTRGSPSKLPLDLDSLQPLDIGEHMASGAEVVILRGSENEYHHGTEKPTEETQRQQISLESHSVERRSMTEDRNQVNTDSTFQNQRVTLEPDSRGSLPSQYLSPSEGNVSKDAQSYIHYPRELRGSPHNIGFSSDNDSNSADLPLVGTGNARDNDVSLSRRDQGSERDLLAKRVALLLQVNSDMGVGVDGTRANLCGGSLSGSGSSSHTGSPDSIEEATLPLGIFSKDAHGSPSSYRRGNGQSLPPPSRSESSGSSNADSLAEHVKRLLQESESMRKLHTAGISPQQLLNIQAEIGKRSPTLSDASTSSSVRDIVNRVVRHSRTGSESDDSMVRPQETYMSPSHPMPGGYNVPLGSSNAYQESAKVTFQDTFQANRSQNAAGSGNTSQSSTSTLTNDSLSQRVQQLLSHVDDAFTHQPEIARESLSREDLLALVQIAELEKKLSESRSNSQMHGSPRSSQNSRMSSTRNTVSRSTSAKDNSVASADSLALRVQAILGREPPGERVDRIISEALHAEDPLVYERNLSNASIDSKYASANSQKISSSREFEDPLTADAVQRPYGAFDRARDMLTLHLQRLEEKTFDHSVDTRTPIRQDRNANMIVNRAEFDTLTQNSSQQLSELDFQTPSSGSLSKPVSTDQVFYGLLPEQIPSHLQMPHDQSADEFHVLQSVDSPARPKSWQGDPRQLYPQYQSSGRYPSENDNIPPGQGSRVMDDSLFAMQRSNSSPEMKVDKKSLPGVKVASSSSSHQRSGSWGRTDQFQDVHQQQTSRVPGSKLPVRSHGETKQGKDFPRERQQEYNSPPSSYTPQHLPSQKQHQQVHPDYSTNSWPRSLSKSRSSSSPRQESSPRTEQRQSFGQDTSATEGFLKPYRPPGSSDVIYTYPVDGQTVQDGSPSRSVSTLESSHAGSNDANAPNFPTEAYGSRPSRDSPHSSKIPRYDRGQTSPVKSPHERSRGQTLYVDEQKGGRSYRRSLSDSSRQEKVQEKEKVGRQISLSPQHRPGRSRTSGMKREHSRSPPESVHFGQLPNNQQQVFDVGEGGVQPRDRPITGHPVRDRAALEHGGIGGQEVRERFGYRAQPRPLSWDPSRQTQPLDYGRTYPQDTQYRQQYGIPGGMAQVPPASTTDATSPSKIPRFRPGSEQPSLRYMPVGAERTDRRRPEYTAARQYLEYGHQGVPQLPGTYSKQVLEDILQDESDPLYREASIMWDQYQRLQQQKETRREARREVKGQDESDVSSLDSRRVNRLAHLVQDPVQHTVQHFVPDETDSRDSSSTTLTDSTTPRQRRKWVRDQQGFTPREQSPERTTRNEEGRRRVSPEEIAAIVQPSPTKESRIPRSTTRQNGQQQKKKDERRSSKRSPEQDQTESTLEDNITQEALSSVLTTTEESLLTDMSLESDRLLELLGPDGIRKLSSKLVKLQRKIDRQREHHRKRTEEQNRDKQATKKKGHLHDVPVSSTPAVDDLSSTAKSGAMEELSDTAGAHLRVGKQASLEPALSPVQEASLRSTEGSAYDTAESTPPEPFIPDRKITRQGRVGENGQTAKRRKDFAHHDDFGVTYTTDSFSDAGSDASVPCACKPKRSHSIHGFTSRAREHATDKISKETKPDTERDEVFKQPSKGLSRIPVRDSDPSSRAGSSNAGPAQKMKPGTAFVIDVGRGDKKTGKDTALTGKQNFDNKVMEEEDEERRRRRNEKKAANLIPAKENEAPSRIPKKIVQPVAWFQPLAKKMPWQQDTPSKAKPQPMSFPVKDEETAPKPGDKSSLQEAFERHRSDFISKSRERQRKMRLAAEERQTQAQFELERAQIFHDQRTKKPNPNAHPFSDQLHKPKRRAITKKQMREQTEKLYNRLPEVKQKEKEKKKVQDSNLNRIRAQMYRKKLSDKVKGKPFTGS
ncbi:uncharacterized protein LOC129273414 [Lytechinus pictus]|uniref:uncharacterized protein LOC129273414 n=1 Tax=Lytechinus pictus TaxID=7653 RepID=UPI0030B9DC5D